MLDKSWLNDCDITVLQFDGLSCAMTAASGKKTQAAVALQEALAAAEAKVRTPQPPLADGPRATLIVCPLSVLSNWQTQIEEHTAGNLQVRCPAGLRTWLYLTSHALRNSYQNYGASTQAQQPSHSQF